MPMSRSAMASCSRSPAFMRMAAAAVWWAISIVCAAAVSAAAMRSSRAAAACRSLLPGLLHAGCAQLPCGAIRWRCARGRSEQEWLAMVPHNSALIPFVRDLEIDTGFAADFYFIKLHHKPWQDWVHIEVPNFKTNKALAYS